MKSGERETYLPGSGYTEGSSNNGSGHGGFPLLMFVPFSLFFSCSWLVRPLFLGLFVPCFFLVSSRSLSLFSCSRSLSPAFVFPLHSPGSLFVHVISSVFPFSSVSVPALSVCFSFFVLLSHALSFSVLGSVLG